MTVALKPAGRSVAWRMALDSLSSSGGWGLVFTSVRAAHVILAHGHHDQRHLHISRCTLSIDLTLSTVLNSDS
jgi:hypothetical protein